jgi:trehalose 6-phosphate phosphatase
VLPHPPQIDTHASALFLDIDGTLLDLKDHPEDVRADRTLLNVLAAVADQMGGALALVSGRSLKEIDRIFCPKIFVASGEHGAETRDHDGRVSSNSVSRVEAAVKEEIRAFAQSNGLLMEDKHHGVALHYRQNPLCESACRELMRSVLSDLPDGYRLIDGKMVFEITRCMHNKGNAVKNILDLGPFRGRSPVYVGDDVTDEDAFQVANDLAGISVRVGQNGSTAARYAIGDVRAVHKWLSQSIRSDSS